MEIYILADTAGGEAIEMFDKVPKDDLIIFFQHKQTGFKVENARRFTDQDLR